MAEDLCVNCHQRDATHNWGGTHDAISLARNPRLAVRWCERCVVEAQLVYARARAAEIPGLEARLEGVTMSNQLWPRVPPVTMKIYGMADVEIFQQESTGKPVLKVTFYDGQTFYATANTMEMIGGVATGARKRWEDAQ